MDVQSDRNVFGYDPEVAPSGLTLTTVAATAWRRRGRNPANGFRDLPRPTGAFRPWRWLECETNHLRPARRAIEAGVRGTDRPEFIACADAVYREYVLRLFATFAASARNT